MIDAHLRPGYAELEAADKMQRDDGAWFSLMRNVLKLPAWMLPALPRQPNEFSANYSVLLVNRRPTEMFAKWPLLAEIASLRRVITAGRTPLEVALHAFSR